jgi:uncharacterized protein (TIGR03437 family)
VAAPGAAAIINQPVIITASGSGVTSQTSTVLVTVNPTPSVSVTATSSITLAPGGAGQTVVVTVTRTNFTGSVTLGVSALPNGVTTSQTDPGFNNSGSITFAAAAGAALLSGQTITITASGVGIAAATTTFSLTVTAAPSINVTATTAISLNAGGSAQTVTVTVIRTNFAGSVVLSVGALPSGVTITGQTNPGVSSSGSVTLTASAGAAAVSFQPLIITTSGSGVTSQTSTVLVTVNALPSISISATPSVTLSPGGAGQSAAVNITRTNFTGNVVLLVANLPNGVTISQSDPGAGNSGSVTFTATVGAALVSGQVVTITASGAGVSASAVLTLTVAAVSTPPQIQLSQTPLSFAATVGGANPSPQTVNVSNSGGGTLNWTASVTMGGWLSVTGGSGTGNGSFSVSVNSAGLTAGVYLGQVTVSTPGANPQTIAVTLTVLAGPSPAITSDTPALLFVTQPGVNPVVQTFTVQSVGGSGSGFTASVATNAGGSWLSVTPSTGVTPATITVMVNTTGLGPAGYNGTITIAPLNSGATGSVTVSVGLAIAAPGFIPAGVVDAADFSTNLAAGAIASVFGVNLSSGTASATSLPLPTKLAGTQVLVNGVALPLFFVSADQINFQLPAGISGAVNITVVSGAVSGTTSTITMVPVAPTIFLSSGTSPGGQGAVLNQDFSPNSTANPAANGTVVQVFATGLGATNLPLAAGQVGATSSPFNLVAGVTTATINGQSAGTQFSAMAPGFAGLYQVNLAVPPGTPVGVVTLQIFVNGTPSNTVTIAVK